MLNVVARGLHIPATLIASALFCRLALLPTLNDNARFSLSLKFQYSTGDVRLDPARTPVLSIQMNDRQTRDCAEFPRERRLARTGAPDYHHTFHGG